MVNRKNLLILAGILGFLGVLFGAFGAHTLKDTLSEENLKTFQTGVNYHFIHSIIILIIAFAGDKPFYKAAIFMAAGILLFSFSLYVYSLTQIRVFAMVTPIGGVSFLIGWLLIIIEAIRKT